MDRSAAPRVSVVINNYNYGRYLGAAIESVLAQDFPKEDTELVVVDDGSTDDSKNVIASFGGQIRPVFQSNQGQAAALNAGFSAARGEIVCLLDSDDWWRKDKLSRVTERFSEDDSLGMVQHWTLEVDDKNRRLTGALPEIPGVWTKEDYAQGRAIFTGTTGLSFRRQVVEKILPIPPELRICADEYLYYTVFLAPVGNIPESLGFRRVHGANRYALRYRDRRRLEEHIRARSTLRQELQKRLDQYHLQMSDAVLRQQRMEESMDKLFLSRYRWDSRGVLQAWREIGALLPSGLYAAFKRATLCLALVSPSLYIAFHGMYSRRSRLVGLRFKLFRD